jgi:hypothetical protein
MVLRVALLLIFAGFSSASIAGGGEEPWDYAKPKPAETLPYDIANFYRTPAHNPRIAYEVDALLYDHVPDHIALGYRINNLSGGVQPYRDGRDVTPLLYVLNGLVSAD